MDAINVSEGKKQIKINAREVSGFGMIRGLMFRTQDCENLLFDNFNGAIHSWFVFFPFLGLWLDSDNKIVHKEIVKPFKSHCKPEVDFTKLVEIPVNDKNRGVIEFLVGKETFK